MQPPTVWSSILRGRAGDGAERRAVLERIFSTWWQPIFCQARFGWGLSVEDARDAVQGFFLDLIERDVLDALDPAKGRLRSFLKAAFANYLRNRRRDAARLKRGGGRRPLPLDGAERLAAPTAEPAEAFDRAWLHLLVERALAEVRRSLDAEGHAGAWRALEAYDLAGERRTYAQVAESLGVGVSDVRNGLHRARRLLREVVTRAVADYACDEQEAREELRWILG
jgi:RNA polymerase sigma-70 factor (ECF subfamily)